MERSIQPGSRQWEILTLVARRGPVKLAQIAEELGLAKSSVRQQLNQLRAEKVLKRDRVPDGPGRPGDLFSIAEGGRALFAGQVDLFARALLEELSQREGEAELQATVAAVGRRLAGQLQTQIRATTASERLEQLSALLGVQGTLNDVTCSEDGMTLTLHTCPYHGISSGRPLLCEMEREMLSQLIGVEAKLAACLPAGDSRCALELKMSVAELDSASGVN